MTKRIELLKMSDQEAVEFILAHPVSGGKTGGKGLVNQGSGTAATDQNLEEELTSGAQGTLSQFEGPVQNSPFYKALLSQGTEGISSAYNNAKSNMRARAAQSGFGYSQPISGGGEDQLTAREAGAQAELPREAMLAAAPEALQAAGETGRMGTAYGNQGVGYYGGAAGLEGKRLSAANDRYKMGQQAAGGLADALMFA